MNPHTKFLLVCAEIRDFIKATGEEIEELNKLLKELEDNQFTRRMRVRVIFSSIEAHISHLKSSALAFAMEKEDVFTEDEHLELNDQRKKSDGRIIENRPTLKENLKIAFRALAKSIENGYEIDFGNERARRFFKAADVRNRITHPKSARDWDVSESDLELINGAWIWFGEHLVEVSKYNEVEPADSGNG